MLTDDEISELAEALWDACADSERRGLRVAPKPMGGACCPFGALVGNGFPFPVASVAAAKYGLDIGDVYEFMKSFDGLSGASNELHKLGKRFREQSLSGEGFK